MPEEPENEAVVAAITVSTFQTFYIQDLLHL